jgi:hypothetical protein
MALVRADVSVEGIIPIIRVKRISKQPSSTCHYIIFLHNLLYVQAQIGNIMALENIIEISYEVFRMRRCSRSNQYETSLVTG